MLRNLLATQDGQLAFDFRIDAPPAKVLRLTRQLPPPMAALMEAVRAGGAIVGRAATSRRRRCSTTATREHVEPALRAYRRALEIDPYLVPALINLANLHYSRDDVVEAQALYERAIALEPDVFEAHFNLGNIFHDLAATSRRRRATARRCGSTRRTPRRTSIWR